VVPEGRACRLAILASHPVQYNAPLFAELSSRKSLEVCVFYSWQGPNVDGDFDFGMAVDWGLPLLEGYASQFVSNVARDPGTHHFFGIDNPSMIQEIEAWRPDVLLIYGWSFKTHFQCLRYFSDRVPIAFRSDSTLQSGKQRQLRFLRYLWLRYIYHHVDIVFYVGKHGLDYFLKFGVNKERLHWAPHSVDNDRFSDAVATGVEKIRALRERLGIPANDIVFLFVGKLVRHKQPSLLLQAGLELLEDGHDGFHVVFVGEGVERSDLSQAAEGRSEIKFIGFKNQIDLPVYYGMASVLVLPSIGEAETWGLVVNEAFATGTPAIVSNEVGCAPDLLKDSTTGEVFAVHSIADLKVKMLKYLDDRNLAAEQGREAKQLIAEWSLKHTADSMETRILEICVDRYV